MSVRQERAVTLPLFPHGVPAPGLVPANEPPAEKNGRIYTKPWVVDLILDLAGYRPEEDLADALAIEPAAGHGVFLAAMARRLARSCQRHGRPLDDARPALIAFEIDESSAARARLAAAAALVEEGVAIAQADRLASTWVRIGDYLAESPGLDPADFVLGNPPYVRLEHLDAIGASHREGFAAMTGRADLYVAFFEAALRGLRPRGVCAFICADRWMLNQYGAGLRRLVTAGYGVEALVEMHDADPFLTDVSAYPAVTVIRRGPQGPAAVARASRAAEAAGSATLASALAHLRGGTLAASIQKPVQSLPGLTATRVEKWFAEGDPWPCASPERLVLLKRLERDFPPLEDIRTATRVGIGVASGADAVFITRDPGLIEPSRLLPLALAGDVSAGGLAWSGHYLVNPWDAQGLVDLAEFPRLASYLGRHEGLLRGRHVGRKDPARWFRTIDRVDLDLADQDKLYVPDIRGRLHPALDNGQTYPHHNLYVIRSNGWDLAVLGGLLLSDVAQFFIECYGIRMRGGYLRFQAQYLRRIRVPHPQDIPSDLSAKLAAAFRACDPVRATEVAAELYRLTAREQRALREGGGARKNGKGPGGSGGTAAATGTSTPDRELRRT